MNQPDTTRKPDNRAKDRRTARAAEKFAQNGDFDKAADRLEEIIGRDPLNSDYLLQLAGVRRGQGRLQDAIELALHAVRLKKGDVGAWEMLIQLYLEAGQYQQVIDSGKSLIRSAPKNLYARDLMGVAYLQMGLLDKALQITNEMVHLDPLDASNHFKRAVLFQQKGDISKAIREFTRVVELEPDGDMAEEARDAITWLDSFQLRQIIGLAMEDNLFRAKLLRDAEQAAIEKGYYLSAGGIMTLRQIDFDRLSDPFSDSDNPTFH